jgi:RHS repeat-associated protein
VELYFYGISGQKMGTYNVSRTVYTNTLSILAVDVNVYFGSRTIVSRSGTMARDRLGSSRMGGSKYYPYGEEQQVTAQDRDKFGTYYRDGTTGLDYAQNRYYANTLGRFTSPDPYVASGGPGDPGSWNRYSYTRGDPINRLDPSGLSDTCPECLISITVFGSTGPVPTNPNQFPYLVGSIKEWDDQRGTGTAATDDQGNPKKFASRLRSAFKQALSALDTDDCKRLFGLDGSPDAVSVLTRLVGSDPTVGIILFDSISSPPGEVTSATAAGYNPYSKDIGAGASLLLYSFVQVTLNTAAGSFATGSTRSQAVTLLHELGHVFNRLYGPQSTRIVDDAGNLDRSRNNSKTIEDNCFK